MWQQNFRAIQRAQSCTQRSEVNPLLRKSCLLHLWQPLFWALPLCSPNGNRISCRAGIFFIESKLKSLFSANIVWSIYYATGYSLSHLYQCCFAAPLSAAWRYKIPREGHTKLSQYCKQLCLTMCDLKTLACPPHFFWMENSPSLLIKEESNLIFSLLYSLYE